MKPYKDYILTYQRVGETKNPTKLRVVLQTDEFGPMTSRMLDQTADEQLNGKLLDSLADELIDDYERKLSTRPLVIAPCWGTPTT